MTHILARESVILLKDDGIRCFAGRPRAPGRRRRRRCIAAAVFARFVCRRSGSRGQSLRCGGCLPGCVHPLSRATRRMSRTRKVRRMAHSHRSEHGAQQRRLSPRSLGGADLVASGSPLAIARGRGSGAQCSPPFIDASAGPVERGSARRGSAARSRGTAARRDRRISRSVGRDVSAPSERCPKEAEGIAGGLRDSGAGP